MQPWEIFLEVGSILSRPSIFVPGKNTHACRATRFYICCWLEEDPDRYTARHIRFDGNEDTRRLVWRPTKR